jgi:uncharacterized protein (TIGR02246 family)
MIWVTLAVVRCIGTTSGSRADQAADEAAIRKNADDYVAAYNKHDAGALAAFWSPEAVYENPVTGEEVVGRMAIADQFTTILSDLGDAKLSVEVKSVKFLSPNIAVEEGMARVVRPDAVPREARWQVAFGSSQRRTRAGRCLELRSAEGPGMDDRRLGRW